MDQQKADEQPEKLRQYFLTLPEEQQVKGWDDMWQQSITPWDRKTPNPALVDTLKEKAYLVESPFKDSTQKIRKKVLVPGCGRGYDVLLFASYGFDAYGLDAAATAVEAANELLSSQEKQHTYPIQNSRNGRGEAKFIPADFFANDFLSQTHDDDESGRTFDLIYDYTFLCALPPSMRPRWAARMSELLSPDGGLICTEFPLGKSLKLGGPPHGLESEVYEQLLAKPGAEVRYDESGKVEQDRNSEKADGALVEVERWKPQRAFEGQEKSTMVSVWRHWKS